MSDPSSLRCSSKACRLPATDAIIWRNPKLHTPTRRKVWTACTDHCESLHDFLALRGFVIEVLAVQDLDPERDG